MTANETPPCITILPDIVADVIVVGAGISGVWCALKLAKLGLSTCLVTDKSESRGTVQAASRCSVGAINTTPLNNRNLKDYLDAMGHGQCNPTVANLLEHHLATEIGELGTYTTFDSIKIGKKPSQSSRALLDRLILAFSAAGGRTVSGWVTRLVANAHSCKGIQYETVTSDPGKTGIGKIRAHYIVLASGGYASLFADSVKTASYGTLTGQFLHAGGVLANVEFVFKHGFGKPDMGALTPTEELQGAAILDQDGRNVEWLESAFFEGRGTQQHQNAIQFWRKNSQKQHYVQLGYEALHATVTRLNQHLGFPFLRVRESICCDIVNLFPVQAQERVREMVSPLVESDESVSYQFFRRLRDLLPLPERKPERVRHIAYFSMGGIAHDSCRSNLPNVFVTGEAMHDFGADRVGGLPWALYLCCAKSIAEQIFESMQSRGAEHSMFDFDLTVARSTHDTRILRIIQDLLARNHDVNFSAHRALRTVHWLRALRRRMKRNEETLHDGMYWSILAEAILIATLTRQESRGCFFRPDTPDPCSTLNKLFTLIQYHRSEDRVVCRLSDVPNYLNTVSQSPTEVHQYAFA